MRLERGVVEGEFVVTIGSGELLTVKQEDFMPLQAWGQSIEDLEHKLIKVGELRVAELD